MQLMIYDIKFDTETECGIESLDIYTGGKYKAFNKLGEEIKEMSEDDQEQVLRFMKHLDRD